MLGSEWRVQVVPRVHKARVRFLRDRPNVVDDHIQFILREQVRNLQCSAPPESAEPASRIQMYTALKPQRLHKH